MKINPLDAHDRLLHFNNTQNLDISECCQDLVDKKPFGDHPFYIYTHARTEDDGVNKRLVWQPRLTKPLAQTNSMLFRAYPGTDKIKIIWMIPDRALWPQFQKGNLTQSSVVCQSIHDFEHDRKKLEAPEPDDLLDEVIFKIYQEIAWTALEEKRKDAIDNK